MSFQLKNKPRYCHVVLGSSMGPPRTVRSKERGLKTSCNLEKWNTSVLLCSTTSLNLVRREEMTL